MEIHRINGALLTDQIFTITLQTGETVTWNVTKLSEAARAGTFGVPRYLPTCDLPAADWSSWTDVDRAAIEWMKANPAILEEPAIAIESWNPDYLFCCFADGQHRITTRQELKLPECAVYVVPLSLERQFRVTGLEIIGGLIP